MSEKTESKTPVSHLARNKRHYMKMLVEGRCVNCGGVDDFTMAGRSRCAVCNAKHHRPERKVMTQEQRDQENANKREWARMRKAANLCVDCGRKDSRTINGKCHCLQCATKKSKQAKARWNYEHQKELREARTARWKAAGLCSQCGGPREDETKAMCATCRLKYRLRNAKKKIEQGKPPRGANGKCFQCNRAPAIEGKKLCQACYDKKIKTLRKNSRYPWRDKEVKTP